eukprot:4296931-Alexandrium_andersonii.AAC.1
MSCRLRLRAQLMGGCRAEPKTAAAHAALAYRKGGQRNSAQTKETLPKLPIASRSARLFLPCLLALPH